MGCAGPSSGLTALGVCSLIGAGVPAVSAVGLGFFDDASRRGAFFATVFPTVVVFLTVVLRVALPTVLFLRFAWTFRLTFFLVAIAASLALTASHLIVAQ